MCVWQNYPDVVDEPVKTISPWFAVYFTVFSFVGMFLLLSLLVAYFQVRICSCPRPLCLWFALLGACVTLSLRCAEILRR